MGKVLITASHYRQLCGEALQFLHDCGHEVVLNKSEMPYYSYEQLSTLVGDVDGAIVGMDKWDEAVFKIAPRLKVIAKFGVGTDNIDGKKAREYGVKVLNAPGQNSNAVAELTIGFMIEALRGLVYLHKEMEKGGWIRSVGEEMIGKTIGLVGYGQIARRVAKKLTGFDVNVIAFDLYPDAEAARQYNVRLTSLEEVITQSDIVSLHIPATAENYHMFDRQMFSKMKQGAYLINAARGAIVDLSALTCALKSGQIAGAALDSFEFEPLSPDDEIFTCPHVICTPHTGAETREAYRNVSLCTARGVADVLSGKEPEFCVN